MSVSNTNTPQKGSGDEGPSRALKAVVIGMGVVLICGSVLLFVLLALGVHKKDRPPKQKPAPTMQTEAAACTPQHYALEEGETALVLAVEGNIATIEVRRVGPKEGILLRQIDICSGAMVGSLRIE